MSPELFTAFGTIVFTNLVLGLFNLIPIPPLDGSKVLSAILPRGLAHIYGNFRANFERFGVLSGTLFLLLIFYFFLIPVFDVVITTLFKLITGVAA